MTEEQAYAECILAGYQFEVDDDTFIDVIDAQRRAVGWIRIWSDRPATFSKNAHSLISEGHLSVVAAAALHYRKTWLAK